MTATRRTLATGIYKAALVDAFIDMAEEFDGISYDIIERELKSQHFYNAFVKSVDWMSLIFLRGVVHWSFDELHTEIVNNKDIIPMLYKYWNIYMDVDNNDVIRLLEL